MTIVPLEINFEDDRGIIMDFIIKGGNEFIQLSPLKKGAIKEIIFINLPYNTTIL